MRRGVTPPGVDEKPISEEAKQHAEKTKRVHYIPLRTPEDILGYVQRLINALHKDSLDLEPDYLGKITNLLNVWLAAYKSNLENVEVQQIREEIAELRRQMEARRDAIIIENR